jgi:hypothetical protein
MQANFAAGLIRFAFAAWRRLHCGAHEPGRGSLLGLSVSLRTSSWAIWINQPRRDIKSDVWQVLWPSLALPLTVLSLNQVGDFFQKRGVIRASSLWVSGCLGVWVSGCLGVWVSGCLGVWVERSAAGFLHPSGRSVGLTARCGTDRAWIEHGGTALGPGVVVCGHEYSR